MGLSLWGWVWIFSFFWQGLPQGEMGVVLWEGEEEGEVVQLEGLDEEKKKEMGLAWDQKGL